VVTLQGSESSGEDEPTLRKERGGRCSEKDRAAHRKRESQAVAGNPMAPLAEHIQHSGEPATPRESVDAPVTTRRPRGGPESFEGATAR
jgi:hypothetical protein